MKWKNWGGLERNVPEWSCVCQVLQIVSGTCWPYPVRVAAEGCAPIVKAFQEGHLKAEAWHNPITVASGLRVPKAIGDFLMLQILRQSQGTAVSVSDEEIIQDVRELGRKEGLFCAPEGAATLSALRKLRRSGTIQTQDEVVLFNTGSGLKYLDLF
jgi:threonine synthase